MNKLYVIGIGYRPLDKRAREILHNSAVILTNKRLFEVFMQGDAEFEDVQDKIKIINNVDETIHFLRGQIESKTTENLNPSQPFFSKRGRGGITELRTLVLLASGDPMFFGIGRRAIREFGEEMVEILPDLSSIQVAFSRIKEPWDDAFLMSLHGAPDIEKRRRLPYEINDIPLLLQRHNKIGILTDRENIPSAIAKEILKHVKPHSVVDSMKMYVCEKLGYPDEKVIHGSPEEISNTEFREPNMVIILRKNRDQNNNDKASIISNVRFGLKDEEILHSKGLITKDEVRAVSIHKLSLPQKGVFWDIGAGSGSVAIETARLFPQLKVVAIERDEKQIQYIRQNRIQFDAENIEIIKGEAPDVLNGLPMPDRVFIGGSGGRLDDLLQCIALLSTKIVVINAATIETLNKAIEKLKELNFAVDVTQILVSRLKAIGESNYFSALNPVFVIKGERCLKSIL